MDFPHLRRDTEFPNISTVDVYAFQNTFDYTRWNELTKVRLVNVIWNSDYKDVVKFESNAERDAWFDGISDFYAIDLQQAARIVPEGFVKLPVPYDVAARYNYLYIEMPIATSVDNPIDWETMDGVRRWYFFVDEIVYRAPNSTELRVIPDVWTNFQNDVQINYMMLERGHAPVAATNVDDYLSNPINNCEYLLAPDVDFGKSSIVASSDYLSFGAGQKWVILCSTVAPSQIASIGRVDMDSSTSFSAPTYSDTQDRFGKQLQVNGYEFGDSGDYSSLNTPVATNVGDLLPNNITAYAIQASQCFGNGSFIQNLMQYRPNFVNSIVAMFVLPFELISIDLNSPIDIDGYNVYECHGVNKSLGNISLSKEDFDFPEEYADFAKLYTFPYSNLEITDNEGKKISVRIEDTGDVEALLRTSVAFPFLDIRVLFTGIGGVGSTSYSWQRLNGENSNASIPDSDWYENCFDWGVPTYSLYMDGKTAYNLHNYNGLQNARRDALVGYHTTLREANTDCENTKDLADTAKTNSYASAATMVANMANTTNTQTANTNLTTATNTANTNSANNCGTQMVAQNNYQVNQETASTNTLMIATTIAENETSIATTGASNAATVQNGTVSGGLGVLPMASAASTAALSMGAAAGPVGVFAVSLVGAGMAIGNLTSSATASANMANAVAMTQCNSYVATQSQQRNNDVAAATTSVNTTNQVSMNTDRTNQTNNTNNCLTSQNANTVACETANTNNDANNIRANADRSRNTQVANADYSDGVAILNAKEVLENTQARSRYSYYDSRNDTPTRIGAYSGDMSSDAFMTRGLQIKVRTEDASAIRQAGDTFARYGYALNQVWDVARSGLTLMKHFTYWKASDIWVDDRQSSNNSVNRVIESMFLNGVTVWSNPDEIGRVSIYAN